MIINMTKEEESFVLDEVKELMKRNFIIQEDTGYDCFGNREIRISHPSSDL